MELVRHLVIGRAEHVGLLVIGADEEGGDLAGPIVDADPRWQGVLSVRVAQETDEAVPRDVVGQHGDVGDLGEELQPPDDVHGGGVEAEGVKPHKLEHLVGGVGGALHQRGEEVGLAMGGVHRGEGRGDGLPGDHRHGQGLGLVGSVQRDRIEPPRQKVRRGLHRHKGQDGVGDVGVLRPCQCSPQQNIDLITLG